MPTAEEIQSFVDISSPDAPESDATAPAYSEGASAEDFEEFDDVPSMGDGDLDPIRFQDAPPTGGGISAQQIQDHLIEVDQESKAANIFITGEDNIGKKIGAFVQGAGYNAMELGAGIANSALTAKEYAGAVANSFESTRGAIDDEITMIPRHQQDPNSVFHDFKISDVKGQIRDFMDVEKEKNKKRKSAYPWHSAGGSMVAYMTNPLFKSVKFGKDIALAGLEEMLRYDPDLTWKEIAKKGLSQAGASGLGQMYFRFIGASTKYAADIRKQIPSLDPAVIDREATNAAVKEMGMKRLPGDAQDSDFLRGIETYLDNVFLGANPIKEHAEAAVKTLRSYFGKKLNKNKSPLTNQGLDDARKDAKDFYDKFDEIDNIGIPVDWFNKYRNKLIREMQTGTTAEDITRNQLDDVNRLLDRVEGNYRGVYGENGMSGRSFRNTISQIKKDAVRSDSGLDFETRAIYNRVSDDLMRKAQSKQGSNITKLKKVNDDYALIKKLDDSELIKKGGKYDISALSTKHLGTHEKGTIKTVEDAADVVGTDMAIRKGFETNAPNRGILLRTVTDPVSAFGGAASVVAPSLLYKDIAKSEKFFKNLVNSEGKFMEMYNRLGSGYGRSALEEQEGLLYGE